MASFTSPMEIVIPETVENDNLSETVSNATDDELDNTDENNEDEINSSEDVSTDMDNDDDATDDEDTKDADDDDDATDDEDADADTPEDTEVKETVQSLTDQGDACSELLAKSNINYLDLVSEYQENGKLSRESLNALEKAGYPESVITGYIEGQQARMDVYSNRVKALAGGEKAYTKLMDWASRNLTAKEIAHYDKAVESYDLDEARFALEGLIARHNQREGVEPKLVRGKPTSTNNAKGYSSLEEMAKAQDDPRYETDAKYTRMVEQRMLASDF